MQQQSSRKNGYSKSIRMNTMYGIGTEGGISTSTYRQPNTLQLPQKQTKHTRLIEQIRTKVIEME